MHAQFRAASQLTAEPIFSRVDARPIFRTPTYAVDARRRWPLLRAKVATRLAGATCELFQHSSAISRRAIYLYCLRVKIRREDISKPPHAQAFKI